MKLIKMVGLGLLLCKDANNYVARTTLSKVSSKIGISKYKILEDLPSYLEKKVKRKIRSQAASYFKLLI